MKYDSDIRHRRSVRLKGYDYSQDGYYFVTICTQNRQPLFGEIQKGAIILNDAGRMIDRWWNELKNKYADIEIDEYMVMPNHCHGIINITINIGHCLCMILKCQRCKGCKEKNCLFHIVILYWV